MAKTPRKKKQGGNSFVLMVGDEGAILVQLQKKRVVRRLFAQSSEPAHTRGFEEALTAAPGAPITMVVDLMDQSYVRQTLPPVSSFSVGKIVRRRLDKDFSQDDIKGYIVLGREKTGRRDWNYLMVSLANPPLLQKWIAFATERPNPFKGISLLPLESQPFIDALAQTYLKDKEAKPLEWQMLVSHHKVSGFRQIVLRNGKLVFTRMAQSIGESSPEVIAGNIEQEIVNTQEYLRRMGLQDNATLAVNVLASAEIKQMLDPKNIKAGESHFLTPHEMALALGLDNAALPEDHFGDVVLSAFIGRKRKLLLSMQTSYTLKLRKLSLYVQTMRVAAALIVFGIVGWAGMMAWDLWSVRNDTEEIVSQQKSLRGKLAAIKVKAKALPKQIGLYTDVMNLTKAVEKRRFDSLLFVEDFTGALQDAALVKAYHWSTTDPLASTKGGDKRQIQAEIDVRLISPPQPHDQFIASAQGLMDRIRKTFSGYEVTHSDLPGLLSDTKEFKTVIDNSGNIAPVAEGGVNDTVKITIKGPQEAKDQAGKNGH